MHPTAGITTEKFNDGNKAISDSEQRVTALVPHQIRLDIQLLRALAILLVVAHHARISVVPAGFLGVDIFFVISGFLMTTIIDRGLTDGSFRFGDFFSRRVRRIFPAAYATLIVCAVVGPFLLDANEYRNFAAQLTGSFGFFVNIVLWKQSEYFGSAAMLKPLLHMWSLSVEEQFYLVLPIVLALSLPRLRMTVTTVLTIGSAILCAWFLNHGPSAAFYLLPTRAWELGIGSCTALLVNRDFVPSLPSGARIGAALTLLLVPLFANESGHPGAAAVLVCTATAVLLIPGKKVSRLLHSLRSFSLVGDRSYSLYLVHWPVFAFANNIFMTAVPVSVNLALLFVCGAWMELQYRFVEQPLRKFKLNANTISLLIVLPVVTVAGSVLYASITDRPEEVYERAANTGLSAQCDYKGEFVPLDVCQSSPDATTLVWGDSYAIALVPGFIASSAHGVIQATRTSCGPFIGLAPTNDNLYPEPWANSCIRFNDAVLKYLSERPQIQTVVLSSALAQYVPGAEQRGWSMRVSDSSGFKTVLQTSEQFEASLIRTVSEIQKLGRRVVLFAPTPTDDFDSARCLDRIRGHKPTITADSNCRIPHARYVEYRKPILDLLQRVRAKAIIPIISLDETLCASGMCATEMENVMLYRDAGHLSMPGAQVLGKLMRWGSIAEQTAR